MTYRRFPDGWPMDQLAPEDVTIEQLRVEVMKARRKFPGSRFLMTALGEEFGELADELELSAQHHVTRKECIQVACVALRIAEEGDIAYPNEKVDSLSTMSRTLRLMSLVGRLCKETLQGRSTASTLDAIIHNARYLQSNADPLYATITKEESQA